MIDLNQNIGLIYFPLCNPGSWTRMRIRTRPLPGHKIIASMSWGCLALVSHFFSFSVGKGMFYEFCAFEQDPMCVSMCCICVCVAWCMCTSTCRGFILSCKNKKSTLSVLLCVCSSWTSCMYACVSELHADSNSCFSCLPAYSNAPMAKSKKKLCSMHFAKVLRSNLTKKLMNV